MKGKGKILFFCSFIMLFAFVKDRSTVFGDVKKVISFEQLNQLENGENLPKYGLVPPNKSNHKSGKNLIMLVLNATSYFKGDWVMAHGLLGVSMLNADFLDKIGYKSLFIPVAFEEDCKMCASEITKDNHLLVDVNYSTIKPMKSIIAKREAAIYAISAQLKYRYIYNDAGNFDRHYYPETNRKKIRY